MIERSHGKARPTLPRSADLPAIETAATPTGGRDSQGRFAAGNTVATGSRWRATIRRLLGRSATSEDAANVARQAFRLYCAVLRELPHDGASVRTLVALQARHAALAAYFTDRAAELGLETPEGMAALERASKDGQRAERLAVTALDVATRLASAKRPGVDPIAQLRAQGAAHAARPARETAVPSTSTETTATENASAGQPEGASALATVARRRLSRLGGEG